MADTAPPLFKKRTTKPTNLRKRPATPPPASSSSDLSGSEDDAGQIVKRRKTGGVRNEVAKPQGFTAADISAKTTQYAADTSTSIAKSDDATKTSHWINNDADAKVPNPLRTEAKNVGPQKAPANVRTITVTDFAPDVCKDYKQTGFCGFGDSCKFLHMREDYKQGWQLDKDWEKAGNSNNRNSKSGGGKVMASASARRKAAEEGDIDENDEEKLDELLEGVPFACVICKKPYTMPIVTGCGHYFCEKCALQRFGKNPNCAVCGAGTGGQFNGAKNLKRLLEKKKDRVRKRKEAARAAGEDVSEDEE